MAPVTHDYPYSEVHSTMQDVAQCVPAVNSTVQAESAESDREVKTNAVTMAAKIGGRTS